MKRVLEISAAEGGKDSQLFVDTLADAYTKYFTAFGWKFHRVRTTEHKIKFKIQGKNLKQLDKEAGGHRIQRVPPTEKRGRVHTSTVTVSVLQDIVLDTPYNLREEEHFRTEYFSGTGKGGQHRNKHQNSCRMIHIPTGLKQERQGRKKQKNTEDARSALLSTLDEKLQQELMLTRGVIKKNQVGSGMRGDKIRTYRFQDNQVIDHRNNKKASCAKVMRGNFQLLS